MAPRRPTTTNSPRIVAVRPCRCGAPAASVVALDLGSQRRSRVTHYCRTCMPSQQGLRRVIALARLGGLNPVLAVRAAA